MMMMMMMTMIIGGMTMTATVKDIAIISYSA